MLDFETKAGVRATNYPILARERAIEKINSVELDARLVGGQFHGAARGGVVHAGSQTGGPAIQHPVVVVATGHLPYSLADGVGRSEIEEDVGHGP